MCAVLGLDLTGDMVGLDTADECIIFYMFMNTYYKLWEKNKVERTARTHEEEPVGEGV